MYTRNYMQDYHDNTRIQEEEEEEEEDFTSKLNLNLRNNLLKCYIWSTALYRTETWTLRQVDQKCLESFNMWCWRRMEEIIWTERVRN